MLSDVAAPACAQRTRHVLGKAMSVFKLGLLRAERKEVDRLSVTYVYLNVCFFNKSVDKFEI